MVSRAILNGWPIVPPGYMGGVLGPLTASFVVANATGTKIFDVTGLGPGEVLQSMNPTHQRLAISGDGKSVLVGKPATLPGSIKTTLQTNYGRSFDVAITISATAPALNLVSMSNRMRQPIVMLNTGANNFTDYRIFDKSAARSKNPRAAFINESVSSARLETLGASVLSCAYSMLTGLAGLTDNQSAAVQTVATFTNAKTDVTWTGPDGNQWSHVMKKTGGQYVNSTYAEFVAAGGSITTSTGLPADGYFNLPGGFLIWSDPLPVDVAAGSTYAHQTNVSGPASTSAAYPATVTGNGTTDRSKGSASFAAGQFLNKNWTGVSGLATAGGACFGPVMVIGEGDAGVKTVLSTGDSIAAGEPGDSWGDIAGGTYATGAQRRALAQMGIPSLSTAVPSTTATQYNTNGAGLGDLIARFAHRVLHNYGNNERSATGMASNKTFNNRLRALLRAGDKKIVASTWNPQQSGGVNSGGVAISAITSSGTVATATVVNSALLTVGQYICLGASDVTGYHGVVQVASLPDSTHFTFNIPNGGSNLAAATVAKYAPALSLLTSYQYATYAPYINRTGAYAGVPFDTAAGDPDAGLDMAAAVGAVQGLYPSFDSTQEGTHTLGTNSSGVSNTAYMQTVVANVVTRLTPVLA